MTRSLEMRVAGDTEDSEEGVCSALRSMWQLFVAEHRPHNLNPNWSQFCTCRSSTNGINDIANTQTQTTHRGTKK